MKYDSRNVIPLNSNMGQLIQIINFEVNIKLEQVLIKNCDKLNASYKFKLNANLNISSKVGRVILKRCLHN